MIELKDLRAGYPGRTVLEGVSLDFRPGEVLAILGPNGCGKSTLLRTATGLLPKTGGEVRMDGVPLARLTPREIARMVAYLPQSRAVPSITAERMVLHGRFPYLSYPRRYGREDREMVKKALDRVGAGDLARRSLLPLSPGQQAHLGLHPVLQSHVQGGQQVPEIGVVPAVHREEGAAGLSGIGQGQILLDGHAGGGAPQGVLVETADVQRPPVVLLPGDVLLPQENFAAVREDFSQNGVEQGRFARAVGAQNGDKLTRRHLQGQAVQSQLLVNGARLKALGQLLDGERNAAHAAAPFPVLASFRLIRGTARAHTTMRVDSSLTV